MFVSVCNKDKERRIGYCLQPLQLLQVEVTGGLTENNDDDMRFGGVLDCYFRGDADSQLALRPCVPYALMNIRNKMQTYVTPS